MKKSEFEEKRDSSTEALKVEVTSQYVVSGKQAAAVYMEPNVFITEWYNVPESESHGTLFVNEHFKIC